MSETAIPTPSPPRSMARQIGRALFWSLSILIIFFLLMMLTAGPGRFELPFVLATGWMRFLARTAPKVTWNWDLVAMGIVSAAVILLLAQRFLTWIVKNVTLARNLEWRWPWRWTWCGLVAIGLFFLVGMCVGGVAHQAGWLSSQSGSWYEIKGEDFFDLRQLDAALEQAALKAGGDMAEVRRAVAGPDSTYLRRRSGENSLAERFQVLLIREGTNNFAGRIIFLRDPTRRARTRGIYWFEGKNENFPVEKLPELIQKHQTQLLAF